MNQTDLVEVEKMLEWSKQIAGSARPAESHVPEKGTSPENAAALMVRRLESVGKSDGIIWRWVVANPSATFEAARKGLPEQKLSQLQQERRNCLKAMEKINFVEGQSEIKQIDIDVKEEIDMNENKITSDAAYSIYNILAEGCFLERLELEKILARWREKKNLILQGPPGTGKTWLAKRLAYALIGFKQDADVTSIQFHPNVSYEDFVRGWRPSGDGKLSLVDGVFMETVRTALEQPEASHVVVIEEINRGNPAQIFGELLTLLETDKRTPDEALRLSYPDTDGVFRPIYIPNNLYVIGTMNIADRSLALVDLALRRRFAFVTLEPIIGDVWQAWVTQKRNMDAASAGKIRWAMSQLNERIAADKRLGKQFSVGHSYVTPANSFENRRVSDWYRDVVETEIGPLLDEYWFDAPEEAEDARHQLLEGW